MPFRILVADQEKAIAETLAVIFSICGYDSRSACGGARALSIAREFQPHIIISEVMMRNVNGIELLRQSRTLACRPKVILVSGDVEAELLVEHEKLQGETVQFYWKPVPPLTMLEWVDRMVKGIPISGLETVSGLTGLSPDLHVA